MKKNLFNTFLLLGAFNIVSAQNEGVEQISINQRPSADAEIFQATIKNGASATQFRVYIRPNQDLPGGTILAGGSPQVAFSVLGTTAVFTPVYALGAASLSTSVEVAGGRSRMVVNASTATTPTLPWPANEERLAYTINITGDDTVGARLEHDITLGQFTLYIADQPTFSDWTHYTDPFYVTGGGQSREGTDGIYRYVTIPGLGVLPVSFSSFKATCGDKGVSINWTTSSEQNASHFEIEKSTDGSNWTKIDQVEAAGNSSTDRNYQYLDLAGGVAQYRIRQVDFDGQASYSAIRSVDCESKDVSVQVYPIPARDNLNIAVRSDKSIRTEFKVFDMGGKMVKSQPVVLNSGNSNVAMNVSNLPSGEYIIRSTDGMLQLNKKFTIAR